MILLWGGKQERPWSFPEVLDYWDARYGVTSSAERVSAWAPTLKGSHSLDQASGAAQPILLPYSGVNYLWLPGVSGNSASTPSAAALNITTILDCDVHLAMDDWTPSGTQDLLSRLATRGWITYVTVAGAIRIDWYDGGASVRSATSTAATGVTNLAYKYVRVVMNTDNGASGTDVMFYLSDDGSAWTQLGTTVTVAATGITNDATALRLGSYNGTAELLAGKVKRARVYNGLRTAGGTLIFDANFTTVPEGATSFTESSSNAATVTINSTGAKPAQIVGSQQLLFDGAAHYLQTANFTLNQPCSLVAVVSPTAYSVGASQVLFGGKQANVSLFNANGGSNLILFAGSSAATAAGPTVGSYYVIHAIWDGASSQWGINLSAPNTGDPGANNPGGITLGAAFDGTVPARERVKQMALVSGHPSEARLNQLIRAIAAQGGVAL